MEVRREGGSYVDLFEAIHGRRSIRFYEDRPIEDEQVEAVLRAAMAAPSAGNQQSWRFIVVRDREQLQALAETTPYAQMLPRAGIGIVICADTHTEKHPGYWVQDCAAAMQNLLLAVHGLGLGAVWLGFTPMEERVAGAARVLGLPRRVVVFGVAAIGHPAEAKVAVDRYDPGKVFVDRWPEED